MYVDQDRIRAQVLGAGGEGWDCAGVPYGVPEPPMDGGPAYPQPHPWSPSDPVVVFPFGGLGQASDIPPSRAQEGSFPVGVAALIFGVILTGFVVSLLVKRSPTGRWRLDR